MKMVHKNSFGYNMMKRKSLLSFTCLVIPHFSVPPYFANTLSFLNPLIKE